MSIKIDHLLAPVPSSEGMEIFHTLLQVPGIRLEQIVSNGQASAPGFWYDQSEQEWVLLVRGEAVLLFQDEEPITLKAGDSLLIPAHHRHRVEYTSLDTVWLALHFSAEQEK